MNLMRLIRTMRESRVQDANQPYIYKHGSKWLGDFRKTTFAHRRNNTVSYWTDASGNRSTRWNSRHTRNEQHIRHVGIDLHDFVCAPRYQRRQGKILQCRYEFKEVSASCVLVKRTNTIWKLPNPTGRYTQVSDQMIATSLQGTPSVVEEQIFALRTTGSVLPDTYSQPVDNPRNLMQQSLYLGMEEAIQNSGVKQIRGGKTSSAEFTAELTATTGNNVGSIKIKELRGSAAKLWSQETVSDEDVRNILEPTSSVSYTYPSAAPRKKIKWHESNETFVCGELVFSKVDAEPPLVSGDSLRQMYRNEGIDITVSIPEKCLITFPREGQLVSQEVDSGVFSVRTSLKVEEEIYTHRLAILQALTGYRIEFDLDRYDFLTVVDIDNDVLTTSDGSLGRIGSIESIDGESTSESESLLDRIG